MSKIPSAIACLTLVLALGPASANTRVSVTAPWVRATVPSQKSTGAYMHLHSPVAARLVSVSSPVAAASQLHQMEMEGDLMKMRLVDGIELPPGKGVNMSSGTYHIMLVGLKRQLKDGDTVPLTLVVQGMDKRREQITVKVPVKPINFVSPASAPAMHP
jgi:hypothetical protein